MLVVVIENRETFGFQMLKIFEVLGTAELEGTEEVKEVKEGEHGVI